MIPEILELEDFLSYERLPPLDLTGIRMACLTGANGHGKSSLLDAVTWALWGRARGCEGGQHQDRLIRDGADEATVRLTFRLAAARYRVRRSRDRRGRAAVCFEQEGGGRWSDLSEGSLAETDALITSILRLDYQSFVHSAYLVQGRADAFAVLSPARRQETLARVLGLESYGVLAEEARGRLRAQEKELAVAQARRDGAAYRAGALALEPGEESSARAAAERADDAYREAQAAWDVAQRAKTARLALDERRAHIEADLSRLEVEAAGDGAQAERVERALARLTQAEAEEPALRAAAARLAALEQEWEATSAGPGRLAALHQELAEVRARLAEAEAASEARLDYARRRARGPNAEQQAAAQAAVEAARARLSRTEAAEGAAQTGAEELARLRAEVAALTEEQARATAARAEANQMVEALEAGAHRSPGHHGGGCPVCGGPVTDQAVERLQAARAGAEAALADVEERRRLAHEEGRRAQAQAGELSAAGARVRAARKELAGAEAEQERLEREAAAAAEAEAEVDLLEAQRPLVAQGEASKLAGLEEERARVETVVARRRHLEQERVGLLDVPSRLAALHEARARRAELEAELGEIEARVAVRAERQHDLRAQAATAARELAGAPTANLQVRGRALEAAEGRRDECRERLVLLRQRAHDQAEATGEARSATRAVAHIAREAEAYRSLAHAFGRQGIPARLIETAVPEIQAEANALLERLSEGELAVSLETLRETAKAGVAETLDVAVWADGRPRDFSQLSGGESFRVSFALRVALSRLLARRAGSQLELLVIDEGFGSQDAEGRARLVEALSAVADQFSLVLVVTHIDEMKTLFGDRIEVTKEPGRGSRARLVRG